MKRTARHWVVGGRVQGVGFRPFVYNLAVDLGLTGWVRNEVGRVSIRGEGRADALDRFENAVVHKAPPLAQPQLLERALAQDEGAIRFEILPSAETAKPQIHVPPDYFACEDCIREMRDPRDRRAGYPFVNCTQCGPRYTLIRRLPYDRPHTTMASFDLCPACRQEYEDPTNRRFHAQPVACAECGPRVTFRNSKGESPGLESAVDAIAKGSILAIKGIGGYHLVCDATNEEAVSRLRKNKPRQHKPLAVMFPHDEELKTLQRYVALTDVHRRMLLDPSRPIVLSPRSDSSDLAPSVAPGLGEIGAFLPYSPLHYLLLDALGGPVVATSANITSEPVLTDNHQVESRLGHVAEAFLHHDRPIQRPADDPVYRVLAGAPRPIRLGRGCAPVEWDLPFTLSHPVLATGGHMKNTIGLAWENRAVVSPHVGELEAPRSMEVFQQVIQDLQDLYQVQAERVVCDAHPGYGGTRWAKQTGLPWTPVYHHHAHASGVAGEFPEESQWIVFAWDAVGYGEDGTLWGGEAFVGRPGRWQRRASVRPFHLPGGERAGREPWRSAAALCWEANLPYDGPGPDCSTDSLALLHAAWEKRMNAPQSTGMGRLFDAASSFLGICQNASFEGQGPMHLEALASAGAEPWEVRHRKRDGGVMELDWEPWIHPLGDASVPVEERASRFHASVAAALVEQAEALRQTHHIDAVGFAGGVFQNRLLCHAAHAALSHRGFRVYVPEAFPMNDGGLCFGQLIEYAGQTGVF